MKFKSLLLAAMIGCSSISALPVLIPTAIAQAPYFSTSQQLEQKFKQVKIGWTIQQVERLLGKPQWGSAPNGVSNYFVDQRQMIKVIKFKQGRVSGFGGAAG